MALRMGALRIVKAPRARASAALMSLVALACASSSAQTDGRHEILRSALESIRRDHAIPAMGIGIIDGGEIIFLETLGASADVRFRTASISKLITAQAVMQLIEAGKVGLEDDVARFDPAFAGRGMTVQQLLTHRSGLAEAVEPEESDASDRVAAYVDALGNAEPAAAPGTRWAYTDAEFNLLGAIVEVVSGEKYPEYVRRHVFAPLQLERASVFPPASDRSNILRAHFNYGFAFPAPERPFDVAFAPSEGLVTNTGDLTRWLQATLNNDSRLLRPDSYSAMLLPADGAKAGLGWQLGETGERAPRRTAQHGGSFLGHSALVLVYPEKRRGFVILANATKVPRWDIARVADAILDGESFDLPPAPRAIYLAAWAALAFMLLGGAWILVKRSSRRQSA